MHLRLILAAALAGGLSSAAQAQTATVIPTCGTASPPIGPGSRLYMDSTGVLCTTAGSGGGGGGGATGSVTAAGTNGTTAQAVQGIVGGIPQNSFPAQYNSTLPTLASGATGYLAVDANGRLIQAPGASVIVSSGTVTANLGTLNGAATAANQNSTAAGTSAASAQAVQGVTGGVPQNTVITGTLPAFAATPTFNVGTTNGLALDATITTRFGTLGQKASAGSAPVVIASDQSAIPVSGTVSALNLGVYNSTAPTITSGAQTILQATANGSLFVDLSRAGAMPTGANVIGSTTLRSAGTNRSASVTTTASTLMAANPSRQGWKLKNDCTVAVVINFDTTATNAAGGGNILLPAGGYMSSEPGFVETGAMSAIAASGTCALTAREH